MLNQILLFFLGVCFVTSEALWWGKDKNLDSHLCPDKAGTCPDTSTCCLMNTGKYGCCPLPSAVCCSDHIHCCPQGFTCDISHGSCTKDNIVIDWLQQITRVPTPVGARNDPGAGLKQERRLKKPEVAIKCPGGKVECPTGNTCCKMGSQGYGCCALPEAVCCADHSHCCPKGYTCDSKAHTCKKNVGQGHALWTNLVLGRRGDDSKVSKSSKITHKNSPSLDTHPTKSTAHTQGKTPQKEHPKKPNRGGLDMDEDQVSEETDDLEKAFSQQSQRVLKERGKIRKQEETARPKVKEIVKPKPVSKKAKENLNVKKDGGITGIKTKVDIGIRKAQVKKKQGSVTKGEVKKVLPASVPKGEQTTNTGGHSLHKGEVKGKLQGKGVVPDKTLKMDSPGKTNQDAAKVTKAAIPAKPAKTIPTGQKKGMPMGQKKKSQVEVKPLENKEMKIPAAATQKAELKKKMIPKNVQQLPQDGKNLKSVNLGQKTVGNTGATKVSNPKLKKTVDGSKGVKGVKSTTKAEKTHNSSPGVKVDSSTTDNKKPKPNSQANMVDAKQNMQAAVLSKKNEKTGEKKKSKNKKDIDLEAGPTGVRKLIYKLGMMTQKIKNALINSLIDSEQNELDHPVQKPDATKKGKKKKNSKDEHQTKISKQVKQQKDSNVPKKAKVAHTVIKRDTTKTGSKTKLPTQSGSGVKASTNVTDRVKPQPQTKVATQKVTYTKQSVPKTQSSKSKGKETGDSKSQGPFKKPDSTKLGGQGSKQGIAKSTDIKKVTSKAQNSKLQQTKVPLPKVDASKTKSPPSRVTKPVAKDVPSQKTTQSVGIKQTVKGTIEGIHGIPSANLKALKQQMLKQQQQRQQQKQGKHLKKEGDVKTAAKLQQQQQGKHGKANIPTKKAKNVKI